jgi:hypothetical protein
VTGEGMSAAKATTTVEAAAAKATTVTGSCD